MSKRQKRKFMRLSIITSTFNSESTLPDTMASIQEQNFSELEYIIVDGGSKDGTLKIIENNPIVTKYVSEPDKGIYDALNKGVQLATGDIIGFVHSDDLLASEDILEKIRKIFQDKDVDGVYGDLIYSNKTDINKTIRTWKSQHFHPGLLKKGWMPAHPTLFLKKEVYEQVGLFNLDYSIAADYDFMVRVLLNKEYNFAYLPEIITNMRVGGASNRSLKNIIQKSKEDFRIIRHHKIGGVFTLIGKNISKIKQFF